MDWILWALLLIIQNGAFTCVSRARNSSSLLYHGTASLFSNGIWFISQFILVDKFFNIIRNGRDIKSAIFVGLFYTVFTIIGSLTMHWVSMNYIEKGKRKLNVGVTQTVSKVSV